MTAKIYNLNRRKKREQPGPLSIKDWPIKKRLRPILDVKGEHITDVWYLTGTGGWVLLALANKFCLASVITRMEKENLQSWPPYQTVREIAIKRGVIHVRQ